MGSGSLLEASWRSLGAIKKAWSAKGGLSGAHGTLLDASWGALGSTWPLQEEFQDRFQPSWGPKGSQKGAQKGAKTGSRNDSRSKVRFLQKLLLVNIISMIFEVPGSFWGVKTGSKIESG